MPEPTPWAPSQYPGMTCACHSPDAQRCADSRYGWHFGIEDEDEEREEPCDCCCHDRDWEDGDEY